MTTAKDVDLNVGLLSEDGLHALCWFLAEEFLDGTCDGVLLHADKEYGSKDAILVTRVTNEHGCVTFHLSPAH